MLELSYIFNNVILVYCYYHLPCICIMFITVVFIRLHDVLQTHLDCKLAQDSLTTHAGLTKRRQTKTNSIMKDQS